MWHNLSNLRIMVGAMDPLDNNDLVKTRVCAFLRLLMIIISLTPCCMVQVMVLKRGWVESAS